jgi:rubrerythrin
MKGQSRRKPVLHVSIRQHTLNYLSQIINENRNTLFQEVFLAENSFKDFVDLAIIKEIAAAELYEKYAERVTTASAKKLLEDMALMERGHEEKLKMFRESGSAYFSKIGVIEDLHISDYMSQPLLTDDSSIEDVLVFAIKEEQKAFELYAKLGALETDAQVKQLFGTLADEEKKHKHDLELEYDAQFMKEN